ncbi:endonuclease/exonuclease/phosphatase family protein [Rhodopirellula sp.]|nr:endonuclease/exonuclease/phosphatase family protein [Rhodopirellula sp.]
MSRRSRRINLWIWIILTVVSGGSLTGLLPFDIGSIFNGLAKTGEIRSAETSFAPNENEANQPSFDDTSNVVDASLNSRTTVNGNPIIDRPLLIATFNIQVLGQSKMAKPDVVAAIGEIIRRFDMVAIQEVRSKEEDVLPRLLQAVNAPGKNYSFLIGPRLGRTISKEQYAFIFDTDRLEYDPGSIGTISDPDDLLHREPFVARFRAKTADPSRAFTFWLVNTHTDPDEVPQELTALADVFRVMQQSRVDEDDVILLGDLNAAPQQFGALGQVPGMRWSIDGVPTNTRRNKTYDNLLFTAQNTSEYTGKSGVFDMQSEFALSMEAALQISDHMPVWSEFSQWETSGSPQ